MSHSTIEDNVLRAQFGLAVRDLYGSQPQTCDWSLWGNYVVIQGSYGIHKAQGDFLDIRSGFAGIAHSRREYLVSVPSVARRQIAA